MHKNEQSKMKLFIKGILFVATLFAVNQNIASQERLIDEIVWVVGDEAILKSEVEEYRKELLIQNQRIEGDPYCFIPEQIAINKLFLDQAKLDSIQVKDADINRQLEFYMNQYIASVGSVERMEEYWGKNITEIREDLRNSLVEQQLRDGVREKHFSNVNLTPSEIRKYYNDLPQDSLPFIPTTLELQIITVEPKIPLAEIDKVKTRLREFTDQINRGEKEFQTLALLYSEDNTAVRGGELGFMSRATLDPNFANVAFSLRDPKKVSNVVESEFGYHIIQLIESRGDRANFRHILLKPKVPQESLDTALIRLDSIRTKIVNKEFSFDEGATFLSYDKDTRNNKGIMVNHRSERNYGTPRFELSELNPDIAREVGGMNVGEISKPFVMTNDKGRKVTAIVKITHRNEGHKANINSDYQIIKEKAENAKRNELMDEWIHEKIQKTYVRIDPAWRGCDFKYKGWLK